mmetsp:Transcript_68241/g.190246  ORF Transcript_68241/g.190246 Transcript_68241/m.190246 type:complete len:203 (+) Transcript_68241:2533-3141(+)
MAPGSPDLCLDGRGCGCSLAALRRGDFPQGPAQCLQLLLEVRRAPSVAEAEVHERGRVVLGEVGAPREALRGAAEARPLEVPAALRRAELHERPRDRLVAEAEVGIVHQVALVAPHDECVAHREVSAWEVGQHPICVHGVQSEPVSHAGKIREQHRHDATDAECDKEHPGGVLNNGRGESGSRRESLVDLSCLWTRALLVVA